MAAGFPVFLAGIQKNYLNGSYMGITNCNEIIRLNFPRDFQRIFDEFECSVWVFGQTADLGVQ